MSSKTPRLLLQCVADQTTPPPRPAVGKTPQTHPQSWRKEPLRTAQGAALSSRLSPAHCWAKHNQNGRARPVKGRFAGPKLPCGRPRTAPRRGQPPRASKTDQSFARSQNINPKQVQMPINVKTRWTCRGVMPSIFAVFLSTSGLIFRSSRLACWLLALWI